MSESHGGMLANSTFTMPLRQVNGQYVKISGIRHWILQWTWNASAWRNSTLHDISVEIRKGGVLQHQHVVVQEDARINIWKHVLGRDGKA